MTVGHNIGDLSEKDAGILWAIHTRKVRSIKDQIKALNADLKDQMADAKSDGFDKKEIADYVDVMTSDDQKKHVDKFNMMKRNRIRLGLIPDNNGKDLFQDRASREQMIDADGYECGLNGFERVSRHTAGSDEDKLWLAAYQRGQSAYAADWQRVMEEKQARRAAADQAASKETPAPPGGNPFPDRTNQD
ncbi:hypothetical protein DXT96_06740 [Agrobacterium sp. ICMP 6402]|uniref:GapR family DNA-binding domain-containing protein n=1 Tax=Agrobacterium sp. ICMP 6402 TaxID=2292443 RepID=UPI0012965D05|nr:hypothetical protein [Agrobacterium sp. ICMP 6402]